MPAAYFDVIRLEQRLQQWAESSFLCLFLQFLYEGQKGFTATEFKRKKQEILDFPNLFRNHLLRAATEEYNPIFSLNQKPTGTALETRWYGCGLFARQLHEWNKKSRTVYQINDDLRVLLQATSFRSVTWGEIPWPFDSFVITLDKPVEIKKDVLTDTIVFSKYGDTVLVFSFLPIGLAKYETLTDNQKERFFLMVKRGQETELTKMFMRCIQKRLDADVCSYYTMINTGEIMNVRVSDTTKQVGWTNTGGLLNSEYDPAGQTGLVCQELAVMVASFALYLTTIPPGQGTPRPRNSLIPPAIKRNDPRLISVPSRICQLTSTFSLSSKEKEEIEEAMRRERTGMILPHWRRGFFRRPNGLGHDPNAPRTIFVRATFVNKSHLPDGNLPGGAFVKVEGQPEE
ncbi:MAG: hypothetical protein WC025_01270 [Candidatus Magasanikbacteria bacterium]